MGRVHCGEPLRHRQRLRIHQFQLVAPFNHHRCVRFRADTQPVDSRGRRQRAIGFHTDFKASVVKGIHHRFIKLQQRFTAGADHIGPARLIGPEVFNVRGQGFRGFKAAAILAVGANEIRIAEIADRASPVFFPAGPEVAFTEATEHCGPPGLGAFALQRVKRLFNLIHQPGTS
jgi:hypothetical protein